MFTEVEATELRALQHRAYGRGGALTEADAARLRELEARRIVPTAEPGDAEADAVTTNAGTDEIRREVAEDDGDTAISGEELPSDDVSDAAPEPPRAPELLADRLRRRLGDGVDALRAKPWARRPRVVVGALIGALVLAFGVGVAFPRTPVVALHETAEQQDRRAAIVAQYEDLDDGSLALIAAKGLGTLWYATSSEEQLRCAIVDNSDLMQQQCMRPGDGRTDGLQIFLDPANPEVPGYFGQVAFSVEGLPIGSLQELTGFISVDTSLLTEEEQRFADGLVAEGYAPGAQILGYLDDQPIWLAYSAGGSQTCLLYDDPRGEMQVSCDEVSGVAIVTSGEGEAGPEARLPISFRTVSAQTGESVLVELYATGYGGYSLTITRSADHPPTAWGPRL